MEGEEGALKLTSAILPLSSQMLLSSLSLVHVLMLLADGIGRFQSMFFFD